LQFGDLLVIDAIFSKQSSQGTTTQIREVRVVRVDTMKTLSLILIEPTAGKPVIQETDDGRVLLGVFDQSQMHLNIREIYGVPR
jgi:hypothetical protein